MTNHIIIDRENCCSALGPIASYVLLHHRACLDEIHQSGIDQVKLDKAFNQEPKGTRYFAMEKDGTVRATGTDIKGVSSYVNENRVLVTRASNGCGKMTHVMGTNGGTMPCGAKFNGEPYFCIECE